MCGLERFHCIREPHNSLGQPHGKRPRVNQWELCVHVHVTVMLRSVLHVHVHIKGTLNVSQLGSYLSGCIFHTGVFHFLSSTNIYTKLSIQQYNVVIMATGIIFTRTLYIHVHCTCCKGGPWDSLKSLCMCMYSIVVHCEYMKLGGMPDKLCIPLLMRGCKLETAAVWGSLACLVPP